MSCGVPGRFFGEGHVLTFDLDESDERAVENTISSTEGCETNPVDGEYFAALIREFWTGVRTKYHDKPISNKQTPIVHYNRTEDDETPEQTGGY